MRTLIAGTMLLAFVLPAQSNDSLLKKNASVRAWGAVLGDSARTGSLESRVGDSLAIRLTYSLGLGLERSEEVRISMPDLDSLKVWANTGMTAGKGGQRGVAVGGLIGFLGGAGLAWLDYRKRACELVCLGELPTALGGGFLGALVGIVAGGSIGLVVGSLRSQGWVMVYRGPRSSR